MSDPVHPIDVQKPNSSPRKENFSSVENNKPKTLEKLNMVPRGDDPLNSDPKVARLNKPLSLNEKRTLSMPSRGPRVRQEDLSSPTSLQGKKPGNKKGLPSAANLGGTLSETDLDKNGKKIPEFVRKEFEAVKTLSYFHGILGRDAVELKLIRPGDFLIRTSNKHQKDEFVFSFVNSKRLHNHLIISCRPEKKVWMMTSSGNLCFRSVAHLLKFYTETTAEGDDVYVRRAISKGSHMIPHDRIMFKKSDLLGTGQFSEVYKGTMSLENCSVKVAFKNSKNVNEACSKVTTKAYKAKLEMIREAEVMSQLRHANVAQLFGIAIDCLPILIVLEFCEGGTLLGHVEKLTDKIPFDERILYINDMCAGLSYIHSMNIIHRDLALRNALIASDGFIKLSDFGLGSRTIRNDKFLDITGKHKFPTRWMAPEQMGRQAFCNKPTDIWSFGSMTVELFSNGVEPFPTLQPEDVTNILKEGIPPKPKINVGTFLHKILYTQIFKMEAAERATIDHLHQQVNAYAQNELKIKLETLTLNQIKGVKRAHFSAYEPYVPQVVVFDNKGNDLGYQDAPVEMLGKKKVEETK